ncbi:Transmembrane protein 205 [Termitomyces sp. T112]|nr:Transmembrane protein 205 [Termitomyces sp. T112]
MTKVETLTLTSLWTLATSPNSLYLLGYAWLFGMSLWVTFFGGVIAFRTLPRQMFGNLQHKTFPIYFVISIVLSSALLTLWTLSHPNVVAHITRPYVADVAQAYALATVLLGQGFNYFVIGPLTSKTMFQRHKLEKDEGKAYNEPGVSDEMKALNRRFGTLHGVSSLANLGSVIALGFHGLWIGSFGLKGK